ncbi:hypothetical protein IHE44_0005870 [Lamprotornis superbus]|uniref:Uncharacterized protein n=1 Tax=Lamprotornis superbus TaxID=245042 RepID=A0A835NWC7_9PASS|nr:hypothetical protein IHE44_0005870 [Lamprotornis superbus]
MGEQVAKKDSMNSSELWYSTVSHDVKHEVSVIDSNNETEYALISVPQRKANVTSPEEHSEYDDVVSNNIITELKNELVNEIINSIHKELCILLVTHPMLADFAEDNIHVLAQNTVSNLHRDLPGDIPILHAVDKAYRTRHRNRTIQHTVVFCFSDKVLQNVHPYWQVSFIH